MRPTTGLGKNTILLHFAVEAFEGLLKRIARIHFNFAHKSSPTYLEFFYYDLPLNKYS